MGIQMRLFSVTVGKIPHITEKLNLNLRIFFERYIVN